MELDGVEDPAVVGVGDGGFWEENEVAGRGPRRLSLNLSSWSLAKATA